MRRTPLALAALLLTAACSDVRETAQDVTAGADKVRDCTALAAEAARTRIDTSGPMDAQDVQQAADSLGERVQTLDEGDVRSAAVRLQEALEQAAEAARQGDAPALAQARDRVTDAASAAAQTCGVSPDRFLGGGS
jgi:hypothetical protein